MTSNLVPKGLYLLLSLVLLGHLLVQMTWWFLAADDSDVQAGVEDFRPINQNFTSDICYLLSHTLIKFSVFVVCGSSLFNTQTPDFTRHHCDSTTDPKCVQFQITLK